VLAARMPAGVIHQYAPVDTPAATAAFLDHWRPDLGVFVESELWPELILGAKARGVKLALISARISARSLAGWRLAPRAARALLGAYDLLLAQDEAAAHRFGALGVTVHGRADLKFGAPPLSVDGPELRRLEEALEGRPVLLAASTHPGEDATILEAFGAARSGGALLVVAPRHPDRSGEVEALAAAAGLRTTRSSGSTDADVLVVDRLGELGLWFRLASVAFVGGSLVDGVGGHNPLEPARLGCPVATGPHTANWSVFDALITRGGAVRVRVAADLARVFGQAIVDDDALREAAKIAKAYVEARDQEAASVGDRVLALLPP
jgi:3-deoxy-D-manno-octulosonic-acid transferase